MTTLADLNKRAMELGRERTAKLAYYQKEAETDELMSTDARTRYLEGWTKSVNTEYAKKFEELKEEAAYVGRQVTRDSERVRPTFDSNSPADLTRTEQAWRNIVLPQLERGRTLNQALKGADRDAVIGAERFAGGWFNANRGPDQTIEEALNGDQAKDFTANVQAAVTSRFADLADRPEDAAAIRAAARLENELAAFQRVTYISESGGSHLEAAVLSHYSDKDVPDVDAEEAQESASTAQAMSWQ
ncbi:hypothetical protein [Rhodococcus sp. 1168]|uniref:hypothetical protein n=1 Tax=Rhodococcus sp. 1168 TaxID=2018041 RepID=UPI000A09745D|nr:hypothetical protein [Rhodococcus sp. 1168]ORI15782.1 hypothetical protein BJI47_01425 [Rhodococcus sp. 1168]